MDNANSNVLSRAAELNIKRSRRKIWYRILTVLCAFVVFITTYVLILPAITLSQEPVCGKAAHTHSEECYSISLTETYICEEGSASPEETSSSEEEITSEEVLTEATESQETSDSATAQIYEEQTSAKTETAENSENTEETTVTEKTSETESTAETSEAESSAAANEVTASSEEHIHTEECIKVQETKTLVCTIEEHTHHEILCFTDTTKDVETQDDWEKTLPEELTGDYRYDLLSIALSQLDYTESRINIITDAEGNYCPYSRYGAFAGNAYCEWQEEFVFFCLHYAGLSDGDICFENDSLLWTETLEENQLLTDPLVYEPCEGDVIFYKNNGEIKSAGIVSAVSENGGWLEVIEGNTSSGNVGKIRYDNSSEIIAGCIKLPEQIFWCEKPAHIHSTECFDDKEENLCGYEKHCHTDECFGLYKLSDEEKLQAQKVISLIDEMPSSEEIEAVLLEYEENDDMQAYEAYFVKIGNQGKTAYNFYSSLNDNQKAYVKNIDRLMDSSWLWSAATFAATAGERADDINSVAGDGIKVQLFNYSKHINKTADHKSWRPIASYFTFRDSQSTPGDVPSDTILVPTWNINSEHDVDGYTKAHATVERVLTDNGTPVLDLTRNADGSSRVDPGLSRELRDMAYLFSDKGDPDVSVYNPSNTFLQKDGNYYWYDSAQNAVDYDISSNKIRLRSYSERNATTAGYGAKYGDFTPFNYTNGEQIGLAADGVTPYHVRTADVDYWFGMSMEVKFFQTKGGLIDGEQMQFHFSGDDDVWVFVDDVLVLDLGGTHGTVDGKINFSTGEVLQYLSWNGANSTDAEKKNGSTTSFPTTIRECFDAAGKTPNGGWNADGTTLADYTEHTLKIFYMERGSAVANCKLSFSLPALPDNSLTVTKDLVSEDESDITEYIKDSLTYKYRVMKADKDGKSTGELFIKVGTIFDILENGTKVGTGTVASDGTFSIKAGQSAQFTDMLVKGSGHINYVVEELLPDNAVGQYAGVEYDVSGTGGETVADDDTVSNFTAYSTGKLSAEQTQAVTFRNKVDTKKLSYLEITKQVAQNAVFPEDKLFDMQVTLGDMLLPAGTKYTVNGKEKSVIKEGIISLAAGETAHITEGIVAGTAYTIKELNTVEENMLADYTVSVLPEGSSSAQASANGVTGTVEPGTLIKVGITNQNNDFSLSIPVSKQVIDGDSAHSFEIEVCEIDPDTSEVISEIPSAVISVTGSEIQNSVINLGYSAGTSGLKYYRVREKVPDDDYIYDDTYYILEVNTTGSSAELISIKKNGTEEIDLSSVLGFVNISTVKLNVTKEVVQKLKDESFEFSVTVTKDGVPYELQAYDENAGYTVEGNVIKFSLTHSSSITIPYIPKNCTVNVKEITTRGYEVYYSVEGVHTELMEGSDLNLNFDSSDITVHFTNDAVFELPATGSVGIYMYTLGGTALIISAAGILLYKVIKRRKEDFASS